jgi:hypothetical protein
MDTILSVVVNMPLDSECGDFVNIEANQLSLSEVLIGVCQTRAYGNVHVVYFS